MDFRSCPACKASVLEDDVDECPFCGASMSGKPQSGKSQPASAKKTGPAKPAASSRPATAAESSAAKGTPAGASPTKSSASRPVTSAKSSARDEKDDPFEIDTSALRRAVKLSPRPTKTRTLEVTCPMCETVGYLPPAEAGKDVHCCNPECLVPVFKTQRPQVEAAPVEETGGNRWLIYGGGGVLVVAVAGTIAYFMMAEKKPPAPIDNEIVTPAKTIEELQLTPDNKIVQAVEAPPKSLSEIHEKSLALILTRARQRDRNRSQDFGIHLAAESFAEAGELAKAGEQIRRLQDMATHAQYLQIQPLVEVGWQQLAAGQKKEAQATVATALLRSRSAPRSIRKTLDAMTSLAALCVATDSMKEAQDLISKEQDEKGRGNLSALWRATIDSHSFQIDQEARAPWHVAMPEPMRLSVIECLVTHGQADKGLEFAATGGDLASQSMCRAAWAGRLVQLNPTQSVERVATGLESSKASAAGQVQAWSAVAYSAQILKKPELVQTALSRAATAAANIKPRGIVPVPGLKALHGSEGKPHVGLPNPAPAQASAQAFVSLAIAQLTAGQKDVAWTTFQQALQHAQGMAPSPVLTQELLTACETQESSIRSQINQTLNLGNNEQRIASEFSRYRRQCLKLHAEAERRLQLQVTILRYAAEAGLLDEVWTLAKSQINNPDAEARDPYLQSSLPSLLICLAEARGKPELANNIRAESTEKELEIDPLDRVEARASSALAAGNLTQASDIVEAAYRDQLSKKAPYRIDEIALRICAAAQVRATPGQMIPFIKNLADVVIQEEAFLQLAGYSMQHGTAPVLWKEISDSRTLDALDYVSIYRGYISGYRPESASSPPAVTPASNKK